ncbi:MAG: hypothetical protein NVSMB25_17550 [Thermoleophilaceae bacterium]
MEAATPLRKANVRIIGDRLIVDGLVVSDECSVRLVREREEAGEDAGRVVQDAVAVGSRILDREQAGANADFVRSEFGKVSREVEVAFADRAREAADQLVGKLDEVFGPDSGHLTKALERHFSDGSSQAVQNRVRDVVGELMTRSRQDLLKQFSASDGHNPLADFKRGTVEALRQAGERQDRNLQALGERMASLQQELQALRDEREKLEDLAAERERGTAKGRTFEELVADAIDRLASVQGDDCDAVGDVKGATGRTGDIVVGLDACRGPARGRIVFEAKTGRLSKPAALRELDRSLEERDADFAVLVVPSDDKVPAKMRQLREYNGDKLIVVFDPEAESALTLEVAYSLARARVMMRRAEGGGVDSAAVRDVVERALDATEDVRRVKSNLTGAETSISNARTILDEMSARVRDHLRQINELIEAAEPPAEATVPQERLL